MGKNLNGVKLFLFDLDGTIYHDGQLIGDVTNTLQTIRNKGCKVVYLTNNSSCSKTAYVEKLKKIGIYDNQDLVYSSLDCAVDFYKKYRMGKSVYAVATDDSKKFLKEQGVLLKEDTTADIVLLTFDKQLNYEKMVTANELMVMGREYICTHPDFVCPTKGISIPDAGSFIQMFKASSGRLPDIILGKPYNYMADFLINGMGLEKNQVAMVGDRLYTDIKFGVNSKINSVLVLSGETTLTQLEQSDVKPDFVIKDVNCLVDLI